MGSEIELLKVRIAKCELNNKQLIEKLQTHIGKADCKPR